VLDLWTFVNKDSSSSEVSFVVLDAGKVVDVQRKSFPAGIDSLQINGKTIDLR
tara:strand:- start:857 stop:1015 length:159 start_codon:yes stop_codon:yes gene_type:complete